MKKFYLFILFIFILSCNEKKGTPEEAKRIPKQKKIEENVKEIVQDKKDPLVEGMELLTQYKKNPEDNELKLKVCEAFSNLAKIAQENGNDQMAKKYREIVSMCEEGEKETLQIKEEKTLEENNSSLAMSLSNFDVQISGLSRAEQAKRVLLILDESFMDISSELSITPEKKIKVVLYTDKEFYDTTGFPPWIGGAYDGTIHLPLANSNPEDILFKKVIKHELTHAILYEVTNGRCPTWLHEGLAQYFEGTKIKIQKNLLDSLENGEIPPINSPSFLLAERDKTILLYQISYVAIEFLKNRSSMGSISNFIKKLGEGEDLEDSFYDSFLFPYKNLTERIKEYLKNNEEM